MDLDVLESFEGPRTLFIFAYLLMGVVLLLVIGELLSVMYDITFLRDIMMWFADRPETLLGVAGVLSLGWLGIRVASFASEVGGR